MFFLPFAVLFLLLCKHPLIYLVKHFKWNKRTFLECVLYVFITLCSSRERLTKFAEFTISNEPKNIEWIAHCLSNILRLLIILITLVIAVKTLVFDLPICERANIPVVCRVWTWEYVKLDFSLNIKCNTIHMYIHMLGDAQIPSLINYTLFQIEICFVSLKILTITTHM